jgi:hypothetical protein
MGQPLKVVFVCCQKLWAFSKLWGSKKHECRECDWEPTENSKGKKSAKEWA